MNQEQVMSLVRWMIATIGPFIISRGYASASTLEMIGGALISLVPFVWSMFVHTQSNAVAVVGAIAAQPGSPVKGVIIEPTPEGAALAQSIPGPTVAAAGTAAASAMASR